jgi:hypothetical protein
MHFANTASALLLFVSGTIAQPVSPSNTSQVVVPARHQEGLFSNFGSSWNKRAIRRPSGKRSLDDGEKEKRYWKVSSVWVGESFGPLNGIRLLIRLQRMKRRIEQVLFIG